VDVKYVTGFFDGQPIKTRTLELAQALAKLAQTYGAWVRLHYVYPYPSVDAIIPLMATGHVLPYLDVPFQHSHPDVLKRMKRPASGEKNLERIARWRELCPQIVIRSTFIAGFPGETEEEFEHLLNFVQVASLIAPLMVRLPTTFQVCCLKRCVKHVRLVSWKWPKKFLLPSSSAVSVRPSKCWSIPHLPEAEKVAWVVATPMPLRSMAS
jgi:hypothetical protein